MLEENAASAIDFVFGNFILQIKTFTNSVFVVFLNYLIGGSIQALCVLRAVQCVLCTGVGTEDYLLLVGGGGG